MPRSEGYLSMTDRSGAVWYLISFHDMSVLGPRHDVCTCTTAPYYMEDNASHFDLLVGPTLSEGQKASDNFVRGEK